MLRIVSLLFVPLFLAASLIAADAAEKPNIVYILADDLGYGDVHCLNPERGRIATPHLGYTIEGEGKKVGGNACSKAAGIPMLEAQGHYPSADLRGSKADIWDGGHRVPFFVRWPGKIKPRSQSSQIICHTEPTP